MQHHNFDVASSGSADTHFRTHCRTVGCARVSVQVGQKQKYIKMITFYWLRLCLSNRDMEHGRCTSMRSCMFSVGYEVCLHRQFLFLIQMCNKIYEWIKLHRLFRIWRPMNGPLILDYFYFMIFSTDCGVRQLKHIYVFHLTDARTHAFMQNMRIYILW